MYRRTCAGWPPVTDEYIEQCRRQWIEVGRRERRWRFIKTYLGLAATIAAVLFLGGWL